MKRVCEDCLREYETNNKHRTHCYECKRVYPMVGSNKHDDPFVRYLVMKKDKFSKLVNPNKK